MTRDEWLGMVQLFMEEHMKDAPDEDCRAFAEAILQETAMRPNGDDPE